MGESACSPPEQNESEAEHSFNTRGIPALAGVSLILVWQFEERHAMISDPEKNSVTLPSPVEENIPTQAVPVSSLSSLRKLFAHLEMAALKEKNRLPIALEARSSNPYLAQAQPGLADTSGSDGSLMSVAQQGLRSARAANELVIARLENLQLLILINRWPVIRRMWIDLIPDFKLTMLQLFYLQDLCDLDFSSLSLGNVSLETHWSGLGPIQQEIREGLDSESSRVELSNVLEQKLLPWLRTLNDHLSVVESEINQKKF